MNDSKGGKDMKEAYIRFLGGVNPVTADALFRIFDKKIKEKCERVHLMISSSGGIVFHGLSLYSFLKGAPVEVYTYNFGSVDSIGVVIFCAGDKRFSVPHARFLIHGVSAQFGGNQSLDEKGLEDSIGLELVIVKSVDGKDVIENVKQLDLVKREGDLYTFECYNMNDESGTFKVSYRMYPKNPELPHRQDFCYVKWFY